MNAKLETQYAMKRLAIFRPCTDASLRVANANPHVSTVPLSSRTSDVFLYCICGKPITLFMGKLRET
ncbi:MAG: hypothetical protein IKO72_11080, partial [Kiritimatiellae bacterium]|nr:hypothetical protein [Kiritimatiellia bacterium]